MSNVRAMVISAGFALCALAAASGMAPSGHTDEPQLVAAKTTPNMSESPSGKLRCRLYFGCTPASRSRTRETEE